MDAAWQVVLLALISTASGADTQTVQNATRLFRSGCESVAEGVFNEKACRDAFKALKAAIRTNPSSAEVHFMYGAAEMELNPSGGFPDGLAHVKTAIRLNPGLAEAYYCLLLREKLSAEDRINLLQTLLRYKPDEGEAYCRLISELTLNPSKYADEILRVHRRYRLAVPLDTTAWLDLSADLAAAEALAGVDRLRDSASIYQGVMDYATRAGTLFWACTELVLVPAQRYRDDPGFQSSLEHIQSYCTRTEHYERAVQALNKGNRAQAIEELEIQIQVNRHYPYTYPKLTDLYLQSGRPDDADRLFAAFMQGEFGLRDKCQILRLFEDLSRYSKAGSSAVGNCVMANPRE